MVGQWMGKARKMAAEFQGQFQEAMREAEMADLKKSFDEVKEAATGFTSNNVMTSLERDVGKALDIDGIDKAASASETPAIEPSATSNLDAPVTTPEMPVPETFVEADAHAATGEPLAVTREGQAPPATPDAAPGAPEILKDAKAS
jgi:sec-independent protein translocase protein TatB